MTDEKETIYKIFECGLSWHPSGWTEFTIHWSDGTNTVEKRPCYPSMMSLYVPISIY